MKIQIIRCLLAVALAAIPGALQAQPDAHYVPGIEGIECATLPPPGFYFRDYNVFYLGEQLNNAAGHNSPRPVSRRWCTPPCRARSISATLKSSAAISAGTSFFRSFTAATGTPKPGRSGQRQHVWGRRLLRREHPFVASETIRHRVRGRLLGAYRQFLPVRPRHSPDQAFGRRNSRWE